MSSFLWAGAAPRLARLTLQLLVSCGGLIICFILWGTNYLVYCWAAMVVTVPCWFVGSRDKAAVYLEVTFLGSLLKLSNLVYRGSVAYPSLPLPARVT